MDKLRGNKRHRDRLKPKPEITSYFDPDPVVEQRLQDEILLKVPKSEVRKQSSEDVQLTPSMCTRVVLRTHDTSIPPGAKYIAPKTRKQRREQRERRRRYEEELNFCKFGVSKVPPPSKLTQLGIKFKAPSAEIKEAKIFPRKPSITPSTLYPEPPSRSELSQRKPKSGTIINVGGKIRKVRKVKKRKLRRTDSPNIDDLINHAALATIEEMEGEEFGEETDVLPEHYLTKQFRRKVAQLSRSTSFRSADLKEREEGEEAPVEEEDKFINVLVQKFRRDSEIKRYQRPKRKIKKGTLENFSFTKLRQPTLKTFYYGVKLGTVHQGDHHFPVLSRNRQGICMPIAAFCFSVLKHPDKWTQADIDDVLEAGNDLFLESADTQHIHGDNVELKTSDLRKYCRIGEKKIRFIVSEPEISGTVRSDDKKIHNLTKALNIFFGRYTAGILRTDILSVAIWKDKNFYLFDAGPRTIDLYTHSNGVALMANFYDTTSVVSVLLDRSHLENRPFDIYSIQAYRVLSRDAEEVDSTGIIPEMDNFQVLDEQKAVALASFDLADKCFGFSRNKQALTIAVVALVYSKITPPSCWHKGTIDKIMIIGNQLFLECIENDSIEEVTIEDLPAVFTIGPYVVEIYISTNRFIDFMFKKGKCVLFERLEKFFEMNSNAIIQIDSATIAVWKQRNIFHCMDPYSRNIEGFKCRDGSACVSMHTTLDSLINTISANFDHKDMIFHIHAMKVCKIHRDPSTKELFPRCQTMNEYPVEKFKKIRMKKGKRKAVVKKVTVDRDTRATFYGELAEGDESILEVGSTVRSLGMEDLPPMVRKISSRRIPKMTPPDKELIVDLDSPSLSDTQIEPPPPEEPEGEYVIEFVDLDRFDLTQEELELTARGEGKEGGQEGEEGGKGRTKSFGEDAGEGEEAEGDDNWYMAAANFTQVGSQSLLSRMSQEVYTDQFPVEIPDEEVPEIVRDVKTMAKKRKEILTYEFDLSPEPEVTLSQELAKETNFMNLPDGSQIVLGSTNMAAFGSELEFMAPFVCIMATAVAKKYSIDSWSKDVVDYVLKCGSELYASSNTRYDQNYMLEIPRISLGKTDFSIRVNYIFDTFIKPRVLGMTISNMLFPYWQCGILVTPTYSCALFYKNRLYYLYDGFGNNEVGLGKGPSNEGVACLARFQDIYSLVSRILYNKAKREQEENVEYNRFVLSSCCVKQLPREIESDDEKGGEKAKDQDLDERVVEEGEGAEKVEDTQYQTYKKSKEPEEKKPSKMGYREVNGLYKIQGTKSVGGAGTISEFLKEDYFVCLCACLMLLNNPLKKWDDRKIDTVIDQGLHIFSHAESLEVCTKKFIKNVIIDDYVFDIAADRVSFATFESRRTLQTGIETMLRKKHDHFILQFPDRCYVLSVDGSTYHFFDPNDSSGKASWTRYTSFRKLVKRIRKGMVRGAESYNFHTFEMMSISKAPKQVIISNRTKKYKVPKGKKGEMVGKPFYEEFSWLEVEPIPWSWRVNKTDLPTWNQWLVDFPGDLYSLFGSLSPCDERFPPESQKKQTLGNLVVAIGMTQIYELSGWSVNIMDSILINGDAFFRECVKDIKDKDYELTFEDFKKECTILPYKFKVEFTPIVEGTIFLVRLKQFNLYKALRLFFDDYVKRYGIIVVSKGENDKRLYTFGKIQESEYFLYDCETLGPPMYVEKDSGVPYILRTTTLNRLLHVMTLTLRGGDFFIFDVGVSELESTT